MQAQKIGYFLLGLGTALVVGSLANARRTTSAKKQVAVLRQAPVIQLAEWKRATERASST